jgi:hypothetical protein
VLGLEQFESWNEVFWTKLSPTEQETRRRETWARFTTALSDPATADAVIARLQAVLIDEPELFACLLDVVFSEFAESDPAKCGSPNCDLPPGLSVRRRPWGGPWNRTPWRPSARTLARALGWPEAPVMAPIAGAALVKVLLEVLWRRLGAPLNAPGGADVRRHDRTGDDEQRHTREAVEASTADERIDQCAERSTGTEQLRSAFGTRERRQ